MNARSFQKRHVILFIILLCADYLAKYYFATQYVLGEAQQVLPGLWFTYVQNTGTLWGLFQGSLANTIFIIISIIVFFVLIYFHKFFSAPLARYGHTLILVGLWGNLLSRIQYGFVVDFIDLGWWPVFNIADICITTAIAFLLYHDLRQQYDQRKRTS